MQSCGLADERRLTELELPWLAGCQGSVLVRIGYVASSQIQPDVYGEIMDASHRVPGRAHDCAGWEPRPSRPHDPPRRGMFGCPSGECYRTVAPPCHGRDASQ
jgi:hypothetical protein